MLRPVAANSLLLLTVALLFNNLTGRAGPHVLPKSPANHGTGDPLPSARAGVTASDIDAVLEDFDQILDTRRTDLEAILLQVQIHSYRRRSGQATCAEIMSRDVVAIGSEAPLREVLDLLRRHHIEALPVTDERARVLGIVTQTDLVVELLADAAGRPVPPPSGHAGPRSGTHPVGARLETSATV